MMKQMMGGLANKMGMGGMMGGGMPDLSSMDPKQLEALAKQAEAAGLTKGMGACPAGFRPVARNCRVSAASGPARPAEEEVRRAPS